MADPGGGPVNDRTVSAAPVAAWLAAALALALTVAVAALALVVARDSAGGTAARGELPAFLVSVIGWAGVVALVLALALGSRVLVAPSVALVLGAWLVALVGLAPTVRFEYLFAGAGLLVVAEASYWSIDRRTDGAGASTGPRTTLARLVDLAAVLLGAGAAGWVLLWVAGGVAGGSGLDLLGVLAAGAFAVAVGRFAMGSER